MATEDELVSTHWDVIVVGTDLTNSLIAASSALAHKKVLHLDVNDFYGQSMVGFSLTGFHNFLKSRLSPDLQPIEQPSEQPSEQPPTEQQPNEQPQVEDTSLESLALPYASSFIPHLDEISFNLAPLFEPQEANEDKPNEEEPQAREGEENEAAACSEPDAQDQHLKELRAALSVFHELLGPAA